MVMSLHVLLGISHVNGPLHLFLFQLVQLLRIEKLMIVAAVALKTPPFQLFLGIRWVTSRVGVLVERLSVIFINVICNVNFSFSLADVYEVQRIAAL